MLLTPKKVRMFFAFPVALMTEEKTKGVNIFLLTSYMPDVLRNFLC